jgi:hypothetical protein
VPLTIVGAPTIHKVSWSWERAGDPRPPPQRRRLPQNSLSVDASLDLKNPGQNLPDSGLDLENSGWDFSKPGLLSLDSRLDLSDSRLGLG